MKSYLYKLSVCLVASVALFSCTMEDFKPSEWAVEPELTVSNSYVVFNSAVGNDTIDVATNYEEFKVSVGEEWCHVTADVKRNRICINVEPNVDSEQRIAIVSVTVTRGNKTLTKDISVIQMGGVWDTIGEFNVYWRNEVGQGQREAIVEILESLQYVEGGTFTMGSGDDAHQVTLSPFYIGKFELTQKQWSAINPTNPAQYRGANLPIENISWADAYEFVTKLSELTNLAFSLPTEAQWEYAARGGNKSLGYLYPGSNDYKEVAHFVDISLSEENPLFTTVVGGTKIPNELGLYDMAGNVAEYCFDWRAYDYSEVPTNIDPTGVLSGYYKVVRGGAFDDVYLYFLPTATFASASTTYVKEHTGFRIVLKP